MPDTTTRLDWRGYAAEQGITSMRAWLACQRAFRNTVPSGHTVTSPASLDRLANDPAMHDVIRATIDDDRTNRKAHP